MSLAILLAMNLATSWNMTERASGPAMSLYQLQADDEAIYWVSCPGLDKPCSLNRLANDANVPTVITADVQPGGVYAVDRDGVYVATNGRIVRVPKGGGAVVKITETNASNPQMVLDDRRIYFVGEGSIQSVPLAGGRVETLARDASNPTMSIAADRDAVFFAAGGEVRRVPKGGGAVSVVYKARIVLAVHVENGYVYASRNLAYERGGIAETPAIVRIPAAGGKVETIASPSESPQGLAVSRAGVFVLLSSLGDASHPDRIVALRLHQ